MCDHLAAPFSCTDQRYQCFIDELAVEIVLGLINDQRSTALAG